MELPFLSVPILEHEGDDWHCNKLDLVSECEVSIRLNGESYCSTVCTPEHLDELALGRLVADGTISVEIPKSLAVFSNPMRIAVSASVFHSIALPPICSKSLWTVEDLQRLSGTLQTTPLYHATRSIHCAALMCHGDVLCIREDIGRHNAFDKTIGWAILHDVALNDCIAFSSGRLPLDMVRKALHAGIPVIVSKSLPTAESVTLAKETGLTLLHISNRHGIIRFS